ncbi:hypothetical protein CEUSTIGMA_g13095.t1 [Chlamydomonas eustigma]|uniref:RNA helicase n=1 Tax=Chlamydomonas eustigma TaxID=1157962 RepID=A0A250XRG8_9CHLO|nr:hypothetical protein CEUSTIGMA_g13095.t1 [Chlamydomonas eustigma]|eukprot:GAX85681.1 hypothetical protein CEUSTIGMA_g13095.t1 [Chlamydomonas eustigma]
MYVSTTTTPTTFLRALHATARADGRLSEVMAALGYSGDQLHRPDCDTFVCLVDAFIGFKLNKGFSLDEDEDMIAAIVIAQLWGRGQIRVNIIQMRAVEDTETERELGALNLIQLSRSSNCFVALPLHISAPAPLSCEEEDPQMAALREKNADRLRRLKRMEDVGKKLVERERDAMKRLHECTDVQQLELRARKELDEANRTYEATKDKILKVRANIHGLETMIIDSNKRRDALRRESKMAGKQAEDAARGAEARLKALSAREAELQAREAQLVDREAKLQDREAKLQDREAKLQDAEAKLVDRDAKLVDRDAKVAGKEAELRGREAKAASKELELKRQRSDIRTFEAETTRIQEAAELKRRQDRLAAEKLVAEAACALQAEHALAMELRHKANEIISFRNAMNIYVTHLQMDNERCTHLIRQEERTAGMDDDPLDAAGILPLNPLTGKPYSAKRAAWAAKWSQFPLYRDKAVLRALVASFRENDVTIVVSGTGSGKTVLSVPLMRSVADGDGMIVATIPKRATVYAAAITGAMTLDAEIGKDVGYQYRGSPSSARSSTTRVLYSTDGSVLAQAVQDPRLSGLSALLIDEVHERGVPSDFLLLAARQAILARRAANDPRRLRLAVMSATIDPTAFKAYFEHAGLKVGLVQVEGAAMFPVELRFRAASERAPKDYLSWGVETVARVAQESERNVALLFVPKTRDAASGCDFISSKESSLAERCVGLFGKMTRLDQERALNPSAGKRIFIATNVAESSLTLPGVTHVVDTGLQISVGWDPVDRARLIQLGFASQAQLRQRFGRAGRTGPGVAILSYSEKEFKALPEFPPPSILSEDLSEHMLSLICNGGKLEVYSSLLTPPTDAQIAGARRALLHYGLCTEEALPTPKGIAVCRVILRAKLGIWNALLACAGHTHGCLEDAVDIAILLEQVDGEFSSLWVTQRGPNTDSVTTRSDHERLLALLRETVDRDAMRSAGMATGAWNRIRKRVRLDGDDTVRVVRGAMSGLPKTDGGGSLVEAVVEARALNRGASAAVDRMFVDVKKNKFEFVYEKMFFTSSDVGDMQIKLRKFDVSTIRHNSVIVMIGKRDTGKSFLVKDVLYHQRDLPVGTVISPTESANKFFGNMVPSLFIHEQYTPALIANVVKRQRQVKKLRDDNPPKAVDPRAFLILDDLMYDTSWVRDKCIRELFMNGRHWDILFVITLQFPLGMPPILRGNVDYVFILRENILNNRKRIYDNYAGMFPTFDMFCQVMDQCTENFECMVIHVNSKSNRLEDQVFWYKARAHPDFKIGAPQFWALSDAMAAERAAAGDDDDDGGMMDVAAVRGKRSGVTVSVKKADWS